MGTKSSQTDQEEKPNTKIDDSNTNNNPNNFDESFSTTNNTNMDVGTSKNIQENKIEEKKYPYKFEYKGDGKSVLLAGDFLDNWKGIKVMVKNNATGIFERMVNLTRKKHQFKFIVDNKWICSNQYPTMPDERGIINNFIDLTNYIPPDNLLKEDLKKKLDKKILNKNNNFNNGYSTNMPGYNELNTIAPTINGLYKPKFDLDYQSNQNDRVYNSHLLRYSERNCTNENNTFKKIFLCPHDKLMHLCPNINVLNRKKSSNYIKISTTVRIKHKFLTFEYITPWKNL